MPKKLPLGLQDFRGIITDGYKYIDKTRYVHQMCTSGKYYFLSRPRRFGKSMTLSLIQELYLGNKELFKGLWIEDKWDWEKKHPVIRISFTAIGFKSIGLEAALEQELHQIAKAHQISLTTKGNGGLFKELITELAQKGQVVVLIDEYDAPIIHYLGKDVAQAQENRDVLREFYVILKELDFYLEFVLLTGVSRFSKVGIFSGINNLTDLSMHPKYATMLGYTQQELEFYFSEEIKATSAKMGMVQKELLEKMQYWYNGYRFEENAEAVYNPMSVNQFFSFQKFENFWFETGTPTFLISLLKQEGLYDFKLTPLPRESFDSFELEDLNVYGLLYQTGYLTIESRDEFGFYELDYPNHEVEHTMTAYLLEAFGGLRKGQAKPLVFQIEKMLNAGELDKVISTLQGMFKSLPYFLHEHYPEKFYHAAIHLIFTYMGMLVYSEVCTNDGRVDAMVETTDRVYIFEFKLDESAEAALAQIHKKQYYQAFWHKGKPVIGVGVNFTSESKNINDWKAEAMKS